MYNFIVKAELISEKEREYKLITANGGSYRYSIKQPDQFNKEDPLWVEWMVYGDSVLLNWINDQLSGKQLDEKEIPAIITWNMNNKALLYIHLPKDHPNGRILHNAINPFDTAKELGWVEDPQKMKNN